MASNDAPARTSALSRSGTVATLESAATCISTRFSDGVALSRSAICSGETDNWSLLARAATRPLSDETQQTWEFVPVELTRRRANHLRAGSSGRLSCAMPSPRKRGVVRDRRRRAAPRDTWLYGDPTGRSPVTTRRC
jgi:hypothetical protein